MRKYISNSFGERLLKEGKILDGHSRKCNNGNICEMYRVLWNNGVDFIVFKSNGKVVQVG